MKVSSKVLSNSDLTKETEPGWSTVRRTTVTFEIVCSAASETLTGIISGPIVNLLFPKSRTLAVKSQDQEGKYPSQEQSKPYAGMFESQQ